MPLHQVPKMSFTPANRVGSKQSIGGNVPIHQFSSFTALIMHGCCNSYQKSGLLLCDLTKKYVFHLHVDPQQSIVKSSVAAQKLETDREREREARFRSTATSQHSWFRYLALEQYRYELVLVAASGRTDYANCMHGAH